jgi:hypothetical protein
MSLGTEEQSSASSLASFSKLKIRRVRPHLIRRRLFLDLNFFWMLQVDVLAWQENGYQQNSYQHQ